MNRLLGATTSMDLRRGIGNIGLSPQPPDRSSPMSNDQNAQDPLEFVRGMWNQMGFSLPAWSRPRSIDELDKRHHRHARSRAGSDEPEHAADEHPGTRDAARRARRDQGDEPAGPARQAAGRRRATRPGQPFAASGDVGWNLMGAQAAAPVPHPGRSTRKARAWDAASHAADKNRPATALVTGPRPESGCRFSGIHLAETASDAPYPPARTLVPARSGGGGTATHRLNRDRRRPVR